VRLVHGRAEARWLPSRHSYGLFRLVAWIRLRRAQPEHRDVILFVDRHQSAFETWAVGAWFIATAACFIAARLENLPAFAVPAAALVLAVAGVQAALVSSGLVIAPLWSALTGNHADRTGVNSFVLMLGLGAAAGYYATTSSWARFVAWQFAGVVALNALASAVVYLLRPSIARLEASLGGPSSAH
jgi:hypothetical protein